MNIGERFYCSKCLKELDDPLGRFNEITCPRCGYNSSFKADELALEEDTMLNYMRFHIGAVRKKLKPGYIYGAYDYLKNTPVYIFEYFPSSELCLTREKISGSYVIVPKSKEAEFSSNKEKLAASLNYHHKYFTENNTLYIFRA